MDEQLAVLYLQLSLAIGYITESLRDKKIDVETWQQEFLRLLAQYLALSFLKGRKQSGDILSDELSPAEQQIIADALDSQSQYLNNFALQIMRDGWSDTYLWRASLYANSITPLYWQGMTRNLDLPAVPGEDSECGQFCQCRWQIVWLDKKEVTANCYWRLGNLEIDHCPTCLERNARWNPLRIEKGVIINE